MDMILLILRIAVDEVVTFIDGVPGYGVMNFVLLVCVCGWWVRNKRKASAGLKESEKAVVLTRNHGKRFGEGLKARTPGEASQTLTDFIAKANPRGGFKVDISKWDVSEVTDMKSMFPSLKKEITNEIV